MVQKYFIRVCIFLLPIIVVIGAIEYGIPQLPSSPATIGSYIRKHGSDIEMMILGASQQQAAFNPAFLSNPSVNLASGHQDYSDDYDLMRQLHPKMPRLKTVVLAMTFAHFDTPPNPDEYWKHNGFLTHYGVNAFERQVYWKDRLLFISNPGFYFRELRQSFSDKDKGLINEYGYLDNTASTAFAQVNYDPERIAEIPLTIEKSVKPKAVVENAASFWSILEYASHHDLKPIITLTPVTSKHYAMRHPQIVRHRDSMLELARKKYPELRVYNTETLNIPLSHFSNHNHLNGVGAKAYTMAFDQYLKTVD